MHMPETTRSALIYIPALPMSYKDLRPKRHLAGVLGSLLASGHRSKVMDFGGLDTFKTICGETSKLGQQEHRAQEQCLTQHILKDILLQGRLDFAVFVIDDRAAFPTLLSVARALRKMRPGMRLVLAGRYVERYGVAVLNAAKCFDAAFLDAPEAAVVAWADSLNREACAAHLPNVALLGAERPLYRTPRRNDLPLPSYDAFHYPAVHQGQFQHFDVPMSQFPAQYTQDACGMNSAMLWVNRPAKLQSEVDNIEHETGSRALHFSGAFTPACDSRDLLSAFLHEDSRVLFSRDAHVHHVDSFSLNEWLRAGGRSAHFSVPSGSQRLLEDFYGECFGVSQVESVIRACRDAGLFTVIHMQFPCPWDDYHTREETVRLLRRSRPDSVCFTAPEPTPGSMWFQEAARYGFKIDYKRFGQWAAPDAQHTAHPLSYSMKGWNARMYENEQRLLLDACTNLKVPVGIDAQTALAAQMCGYADDSAAFQTLFTQASATLDVETMGELMHDFNAKAQVPKVVEMQPAFTAYRIAVGN